MDLIINNKYYKHIDFCIIISLSLSKCLSKRLIKRLRFCLLYCIRNQELFNKYTISNSFLTLMQ
jgi:hypothetical protein